MVINELSLRGRLQCLLRQTVSTIEIRPQDMLYDTSRRVVSWALLQAMDGSAPKLQNIREKFCSVWKSVYYPQYEAVQPPPDDTTYWLGPRRAAQSARKIRDLLARRKVVQPVTNYSLGLSAGTVTGAYGMVANGQTKYILLLCQQAPKHLREVPGIVGLARWLHATGEGLHQEEVKLLHVPLFRGEPWILAPKNRGMALAWLEDALGLVLGPRKFPVPGPFCSSCTKPCQKVF